MPVDVEEGHCAEKALRQRGGTSVKQSHRGICSRDRIQVGCWENRRRCLFVRSRGEILGGPFMSCARGGESQSPGEYTGKGEVPAPIEGLHVISMEH